MRFEANWTKVEQGENIIKKNWAVISTNQGSMDSVQKKLYMCSQDLFVWNSKQMIEYTKDLKKKSTKWTDCKLEKAQVMVKLSQNSIMRLSLFLIEMEDQKRNWYYLGD